MKNYIYAGIAALTAFSFGSGLKKLYDVAKSEKIVLEQSEQLQEPVTIDGEKTISGLFINKKGIESWLLSLNESDTFIGKTDSDTKPMKLPKNNNVLVCSGYGCKYRQTFRFNEDLFNTIKGVLDNSTDAESERKNLVEVLTIIKSEVGLVTNTSNDKPGEPFLGNGKKDQMSTLDETANTTQYLYVLAESGYLRFHHLNKPETGKFYIGTVSSLTDASTNKHYNVAYDKEGKPVIIPRN